MKSVSHYTLLYISKALLDFHSYERGKRKYWISLYSRKMLNTCYVIHCRSSFMYPRSCIITMTWYYSTLYSAASGCCTLRAPFQLLQPVSITASNINYDASRTVSTSPFCQVFVSSCVCISCRSVYNFLCRLSKTVSLCMYL